MSLLAGNRSWSESGSGGPWKAVLFDWDGTLLDSAEASFRCYRILFATQGIDFTRELFTSSYAPDWYRTYERVGLPRERWAEADAKWLEIYSGESCSLLRGASDALARVSSEKAVAGLVTSGSRVRVQREISSLGLAGRFATVVCGEDAARKKPHPDALRTALRRLGISSSEAAYVGDSPEDVEMAREAGVYSVAVEGGFPNGPALRSAGADLFADDLAEAIDGLFGQRRAAAD